MSKIQEFIDAWNSEVDTKIAETQIKLDKYLVARKSAIALSEPLILKMPTLKTSTSGSFTIPGFDVTTLGQLVDWSYPIDGNPIVDEFGNRKEKSAVVRIYSRFKITDTSLYTDGYTYGTMSYLAQQYKTAIKVSDDDLITGTTGVDDLVILEENSNEFNNLESYKKLKSLGGKAWFDFWMHSLYSVIFDTKISVSKLKPSEYSELFMTIEDILHDRYLKGYYYQGARFRFDGFDASSEKSKYFKAILEAGDNFFTSQISGTQSGTQSGDYILSVINPLSDAEKKISGKITFIETGSYIIPNSTLSGLPNPWKNPKTNTEVPNNTGIITFNGGKSKSDKKSLADEAVIGLQNIIDGTYGLTIYLKYQESDTAPVVPPSDAPTGSTASAITGASESSVPDPTPNTTISTQEFTFNVEQLDIFSNADFGNLFIIGQEDETLLYDDGTETYGSEYIEDEFSGAAEIAAEQLAEIKENDFVETQRATAAKQDTGDTTSAPIKGSPLLKTVLSKAGYKPGTLEYEFALTIGTKEGWLPNANNGKGSRAYRNNNPGNLDYSAEFKKIDPNVTREPGSGSRFARFSTAELGIKALVEGKIKKWASGKMPVTSGNQKLIVPISDKWVKGTPPTLAQFMYTYAPPNENDTEGYLKNVVSGIKKVHSNVTRSTKVKEYIT